MSDISAEQALQAALQCQQAGQLQQAEAMFQDVLRQQPHHPDALHYLGFLLHQMGRSDAALEMLLRSVEANPDVPHYQFNLGEVLAALGRTEEAADCYRTALSLRSDYVEAYHSLALVLRRQGKTQEMFECYRRALTLLPDSPELYNNLGNAFQEQARYDKAIECYKKTLSLRPDFAEAYNNLGIALQAMNKLEEATRCYRRAIALDRRYAVAYSNLASVYREQGQYEEAIGRYRKAVQLKGDYAVAYNALGSTLRDCGRVDDAIRNYRKSLSLRPDYPAAHSNLLLAMHYLPRYDARTLASEYRRWVKQHAEPLKRLIPPHANAPEPDRPLRIGYVSGDFREHPLAFFIRPVLAHHDHERCEVYCYANVRTPDAVTQHLLQHATQSRNIARASDEQTAEMIRRDQIDVLVDLSGHYAGNRLGLFSLRPAPVQVSWLRWPDTTGLGTMDYRLSDARLDPETCEPTAEQTVRLPGSFLCYEPPADAGEVAPLPADAADQLTFGCLNTLPKITAEMIQLWARILSTVPGSRLVLKAKALDDAASQRQMRQAFAAHNIREDQLDLLGRTPWFSTHLRTWNRIDIALDTSPFNGMASTCEALWMGVPVVTLTGSTHASRIGASLLGGIGLGDLVTGSAEHYASAAIKLGQDRPRLRELRQGLRERMTQAPLMDAKRFTRHLEDAYRQMWRVWCAKSTAR